ncbi:MAG: Acetyltransferase domain [Gaiellales bacterium]|nr:Acetyltransferase domain [Gaiellales bacterium]
MSEITVRDAAAAELAQLLRLAEVAVPGEVIVAGGDLAAATLQRTLAGDRVFVAECEGRRVGYAAVSEAEPALVLDQLVVAATDQGRGVGHALLDWVEGYGVSRGLQTVRVPATGADQRARDFYLRRGYLDGGPVLERELVHA